MDKSALRKAQAPLKDKYQQDPLSAATAMTSRGTLAPSELVCKLEERQNYQTAGLHPMAGGDGSKACSGDMLLDALVACSGVTLLAVATSLEIPLTSGVVTAEGDLDFRGTLGVERGVPVGFSSVTLEFELASNATDEQLTTLAKLTERYCVVAQSMSCPITLKINRKTAIA